MYVMIIWRTLYCKASVQCTLYIECRIRHKIFIIRRINVYTYCILQHALYNVHRVHCIVYSVLYVHRTPRTLTAFRHIDHLCTYRAWMDGCTGASHPGSSIGYLDF